MDGRQTFYTAREIHDKGGYIIHILQFPERNHSWRNP